MPVAEEQMPDLREPAALVQQVAYKPVEQVPVEQVPVVHKPVVA